MAVLNELAVRRAQKFKANRSSAAAEKLKTFIGKANIADDLDDQLLSEIGQDCRQEYQIDEDSRSDWKEKTEKAMDLAMQVAKVKTYPWPKASNVIYPLMTNAAIQFAARAYPAIIADKGIVRGLVIGRDEGTPQMGPLGPIMNPQNPQQPLWEQPPGAKTERAKKIGEHMSWQLLQEQPEWEPETDKLLHILPIVGCVFRKTYFDSSRGRNMSVMVTAMDVVINYKAKSVETAQRVTEILRLYPNEVVERERTGIFIKNNYGASTEQSNDKDALMEFHEQHRWLDLDDDGYKEPYIVTYHKDSAQVARIVARYDEEGIHITPKNEIGKIEPIQYYTKYDFLPSIDGGIYGIGFGQLLKPINEAVNTSINMLIDAGHLAITGGGFVGKQLSMNTGSLRFAPGEYKTVNVTGATARDSIVPLQFPQPSPVLFQLLGMLVDAGREIASVKDVLMGVQQNSGNTAATTTLALIEQGLKVFTAIYKRVYRSLKSELDKLYRLNRIYLEQEMEYEVGGDWRTITKDDYEKGAGVAPISDPSMVSDMQEAARSQLLLTFKDDPALNKVEIYKRAFGIARVDRIDDLFNKGPFMPAPELMLAAEELDIKRQRFHAMQILDMAKAVMSLASANAQVGDQRLVLLEREIGLLERELTMKNDVDKLQDKVTGNDGGAEQTT